MVIAVGFGAALIKKDGEIVFSEQPNDNQFRRLSSFERLAAKDPDHDWRCVLDAPLRSREYQRHGTKRWVLVKSGPGFA